jgi:hypothetical protein
MSLDVYLGDEYQSNITHNLGSMASAAGIYKHLWRPEEIGVTKARQLIEPLRVALDDLRERPDFFKEFNPENGWGTYEGFLSFVERYAAACEQYPNETVSVRR